ncbi:hypothetical protein EV138_4995 [Kribbella voronezhensis]|uniref:Uncharacterized protein n=1 Tax=Kribbella voronezhensis TaxID=2512212 RepID=A0A4R7THP6_9ACTN|nr:hypothetical protein [Kribbella voronezhensis]TDU91389.1 hypothetical protein EV138_4995 [Kribbella voronezhensis]
MSYELAVWEGDVPCDDKAAGEEFEGLYERYFVESPRRAHGVIRAYVEELVERWPEGEGSPWVTTPLIDSASGPIVYFSMVYSRADEVSEGAAQLAAEYGLVCFDANRSTLRGAVEGLTITTQNGRAALPALWFPFVLNELRQTGGFIAVNQSNTSAKARNDNGTLTLEYHEKEQRFQTKDVPLDQIADALSQLASGQRQFIARHTWRRLTPEEP